MTSLAKIFHRRQEVGTQRGTEWQFVDGDVEGWWERKKMWEGGKREDLATTSQSIWWHRAEGRGGANELGPGLSHRLSASKLRTIADGRALEQSLVHVGTGVNRFPASFSRPLTTALNPTDQLISASMFNARVQLPVALPLLQVPRTLSIPPG